MSFLRFLKKENKKESLDELDLPPAPPPLEDVNRGIGDGMDEMPQLPDFPQLDEKISAPEDQKFDFSQKEMEDFDKQPDFPSFPEMEDDLPEPSEPPIVEAKKPVEDIPAKPQIRQEAPIAVSYPKIHEKLFSSDKSMPRHHTNVKTIYVRIDSFKAALGNINVIRNDLRKSDEILNKLEGMKSLKDKSFEKVRSSFDDLQKKLIFMDRTLFKGE